MSSDKKKKFLLPMFYMRLIGLGVMFFGVFAMLFQSFDHPIYGYINFGEHHRFLGAGIILLSIAFMVYIRGRN